jgi:hypothetical protein
MTTQIAPRDDRKSARTKATSTAKARGLPLLLPIKGAAHELSISTRQVYYLVEDGTLELVKIGERMSRITSRSVRRAAARRSKPGQAPANLKNSGVHTK